MAFITYANQSLQLSFKIKIIIKNVKVMTSFQMWFYTKAPLAYPLKMLGKLRRRAALWISGAFKTALSAGVEAIAGLIPPYPPTLTKT